MLGTICDLTAYSVVACGVGVTRVERLKDQAAGPPQGRKPSRVLAVTAEPLRAKFLDDRLYLFGVNQPSHAGEFKTAIEAWAASRKPGVAQFKFSAGGWHTFAVLKLEEGAGFILYQSYEGCYRLCDFLETDTFSGRDRAAFAPGGFHGPELERARRQVAATAALYGRGNILSAQDFADVIVNNFKLGLTSGEGMLKEDYIKLSGHHIANFIPSRWAKQNVQTLFLFTFDALQASGMVDATYTKLRNDSLPKATGPVGEQ
jgi:hypothetical protein